MKRAFMVVMVFTLMALTYTTAIAAPGDNLMVSAAIVDCSGYDSENERPAFAIDGNRDTKWHCTMGSSQDSSITQYGTNLNWITFDLGEEKHFVRYDIAHASLSATDFGTIAYNTLEWAVLVSNDLKNWTEVSHITNNNEALTIHEIPLTCARYVRLVVIKGEQSGAIKARISEFMLYESDENGFVPATMDMDAAIREKEDILQQARAAADAKFVEEIQVPARIYWAVTFLVLCVMLLLVRQVRKRYTDKSALSYAVIRNKWMRLFASAGICMLAASSIMDNYNGTLRMFMFYTYLSNLLVVVVFALQTICCLVELTGKNLRVPSCVKSFSTLAILFTFLTVFFVISPFAAPADWLDCRVHYLVPLLTLAEWILLEPHGRMRVYHPFCWIMAPIMYFSYVLVFCVNGIKFDGVNYVPYFFMDMHGAGWPFVLSMMAVLAGIFLVVGLGLLGIDKLLGKIVSKANVHFGIKGIT